MATNDQWGGAVRYANGAVYFPNYHIGGNTTGTFVMPNGKQIANSPTAKADIEASLNGSRDAPFTPTTQKGGQPGRPVIGNPPPPSDPRQPRGPLPNGDPPPTFDPWGSKGGQPGPGDPGTPPGGTPGGSTPTPTTPPTDPFGPNFSKGQPAAGDGMSPNQYFAPFLQQMFGSGYNPYGGYPGGQQPGGLPGQNNQALGYDPLGIGQGAYMDPNASVYGMTGVNAVNGTSSAPHYGVVGGNGGYGMGFVGDEYTGPIWDNVPDINKLMAQRQQIMTPTGAAKVPDQPNKGGQPAAAGGWGMNSPNQAKKLFAEGGGTQEQWRAQRRAGDPTSGGAPGYPPATTPPATTPGTAPNAYGSGPTHIGAGGLPMFANGAVDWGAYNAHAGSVGGVQQGSTDQYGNVISQDAYNQRLQDWKNNGTMYSADIFNTPYGQLTTSSSGNGNLFKRVGGDENDLYQYNPETSGAGDSPSGWKRLGANAARYGDYNYPSPTTSMARAQAAGAVKSQYGRDTLI